MKDIDSAEATVFERMLDMLSEGSVTRLMGRDEKFADYIEELCTSIDQYRIDLVRTT